MNIVFRLSTTNMASVCLVCLFAYIVAQNEIIQFNMCHLNAIVTQKVFFERPRHHDPGFL